MHRAACSTAPCRVEQHVALQCSTACRVQCGKAHAVRCGAVHRTMRCSMACTAQSERNTVQRTTARTVHCSAAHCGTSPAAPCGTAQKGAVLSTSQHSAEPSAAAAHPLAGNQAPRRQALQIARRDDAAQGSSLHHAPVPARCQSSTCCKAWAAAALRMLRLSAAIAATSWALGGTGARVCYIIGAAPGQQQSIGCACSCTSSAARVWL